MTDFEKLSNLMRRDWDRRISHDYRFWMSDGVETDSIMWSTGQRDYQILTDGLIARSDKVFVELGCGVGRILKQASQDFGKVIGVDVSDSAIKKAKELIGEVSNLTFIVGDGYSLRPLENDSVDVLVSFAAITSMPSIVIASYLREIRRVIKADGTIRLQIYLGAEQYVTENDTLHIRCFSRENFISAVEAAGLHINSIKELVLPFKVSFKEIGIEAFIATLSKSPSEPASVDEIKEKLLPEGVESADNPVSAIEFWMSYNYAKDLLDKGEKDRARLALEYAESVAKTTALDVSDLLQQLVSRFECQCSIQVGGSGAFKENVALLEQVAPDIIPQLPSGSLGTEVRATKEGPVIFLNGQCLDHPDKPVSAAKLWAKRALQEQRLKEANHIVVYGFGLGYHLEALKSLAPEKKISVIEPSPEVLSVALSTRSFSELFYKLEKIDLGVGASAHINSEMELLIRPQTQAVSGEILPEIKSLFYGKRGLVSLHPRIAVLGPLQGGTLPITAYTNRALQISRQRSREIDMSGFAQGYHLFENFSKDKVKQSVLQGVYVDMLAGAVMESFVEKPIDILICMAQAPITGRILTELRRQGVITVLWFVEDYRRFTYWREMAQYYDFVFTIQKDECIDCIRRAGAGRVAYLPCACDPGIHRPLELDEDERKRWGSSISFVGAGYHNRQQMFASFADYDFKLWGTEWPTCIPFNQLVQEGGRRIAPDEYVKIFNSSCININLHSSSERDGVEPYGDFVNPRTFEIASSGGFQLVDGRTLLPEIFKVGEEIITFESMYDLREKIGYYLNKPEERMRIAEASRLRVQNEHTYGHRLQQMLSFIYTSKFEHLKAREDASPWKKLLLKAKGRDELYQRCQDAFVRGEEPILDGLISDIIIGRGKLSETEQKLLFLYHVRKQMIRMRAEETGENK